MTQGTVLDRSILAVVPHADETSSRKQGIKAEAERFHRLHGTSLIYEATKILKLSSAAPFATACCIFHRFHHQVSIQEVDVWSSAMAATLLAIKVEEVAVSLRQIVVAFAHVFRRRQLVLVPDEDLSQVRQHEHVIAPDVAKKPLQEKLRTLQETPPTSLSPMGPLWKEWHTVVSFWY